MEEISFSDWQELDMRVGKVVEIERVPDTDKLYKMQVDVGRDDPVQLVTSLVPYYEEDELLGEKIVVLVNLEPAEFCGEKSEGMIICAEDEEKDECVFLTPEDDIDVGTKIT